MLNRRGFLKGLIATGALAVSCASVRATVLQPQVLVNINGVVVSPDDLLIYWGPGQGGDTGTSVRVFAYPRAAWHFTGYSGGNLNNPNVPIMADRSVTILGSNDNDCFGAVFPSMLATDPANGIYPACMNSRICDPLHVSDRDNAFMFVRPMFGGSYNPAGADCGVLLFCSKQFGPRS